MRRKFALILAAFMILAVIPFGMAENAQAATDYSNIRVLLSVGSNVTSFGMTINGSYFIKENGVSFTGGTLTAAYSGGKIVLSHSTAGQIYSGSSVNIMREKVTPSAGYIRATVNGVTRNYLGHFTIKASGSGIRVINTVHLAHYLYGVVRGEMGNAFPLEALKAQAIAAKSYVLSGLTPGSDYDIGDTAADQVYKGYDSSETAVIAAVDATYDIGLYLGSNILCAYYAASNGGSTLLPSDVWSGTERYVWDKAYTRGTDQYDTANPNTPQETILLAHDGDRSMSSSVSSKLRSAIGSALISAGYMTSNMNVTSIDSISNVEKSGTYNAYITLVITISNGQQSSIRCGVDLRSLFSIAQRNSMRLVTITETNKGFQIFLGRYGHGVGMSQRGAEQMANKGMKYDKILSFYYPGASLRSMGISAPQDTTNPGGSSSAAGDIIATAVTTGNVNLRKGPSNSTANQVTVPKGTSLNLYALENGYYLTQYNGKTGYVSNTLVSVTPVTNTSDDNTGGGENIGSSGSSLGANAKGKVTSDTYMRSNASASGSIVAMVRTGVEIDLLGENGSFYNAYVQGYQGYVLKSDVQVTNAGTSSSTGSPSSGNYTATGETTASVNFRKGPGTNYASMKLLAKGTKLNIYSKANGWYYVNVSGTDGYINAAYVKETGTIAGNSGSSSSSTSSGPSVTAYGETTAVANLRKGAGTNYAIIKSLAKGTKFDIYGKSGSWYHVSVNGTEGYLHPDNVKQTGTASSSSTNTGSTTGSGTGETTTSCNFRKGPSTSHGIIRLLNKGTAFTIYSKSNDWYYVNISGTDGYIHGDYVRETTGSSSSGSSPSSSNTQSFSGTVINDWVWLRSTPEIKSDNSNAVRQYSVGTKVTVYSQNGSFYKVSVDGLTGYMHKDYVRVTSAN